MKLRNKWDGITLELVSKANAPLILNQRFDGPTEELKVLIHDEQINIENVTIKIGGFEYEVEMSLEESIQQIKNVKEICAVIRDEVRNFTDFMPEMFIKFKGIEAELNPKTTTEEPAPVTEDTPAPVIKDIGTQIKEGLAAALAGFNISKS